MHIEDIPDDCVIVAPSNHRGTRVYHTRNCGRFPNNPTKMRLEMAKAWGFKHCAYCKGDGNPNSKKGRTVDRSYQDALKEAAQND